jgi:ribosome biogenesis GTPase
MRASADNTLLEGTVLSCSRRSVTLLTKEKLTQDGLTHTQTIKSGTTRTSALNICVGDRVAYQQQDASLVVQELLPRRNQLLRLYRAQKRAVICNLDHLFIVSAVGTLFQTIFIDRVLAVAHAQGIECSLILNKADLGLDSCQAALAIYRALGIRVICTSAKYSQGLDELREILANASLGLVALTGVSGVGKSSLLNRLVPEVARATAAVSERSGQGKQTTSQAVAYSYSGPRPAAAPLLVADLPGIQDFGVGHLQKAEVRAAFFEFDSFATKCQFSDCFHHKEPVCGVKQALSAGAIAGSRYESYLKMLEEVAQAREY